MIRFFRKKWLLALSLSSFLFTIPQVSLVAQSYGGGLMYSSYLPLASLYNLLTVENKAINKAHVVQGFKFAEKDIIHYAPGFALTGAFALSGLLTTLNIGLMAGPGKDDNIIPNFPVRPFVSVDAGYKFTPAGLPIGIYGVAGLYFDFALGPGKNSYDRFHLLGFFRLGPGISLKIQRLEVFAQVQLAIGVQMETISQTSKAGNELYDATFIMVPFAIFPELGVRFWS